MVAEKTGPNSGETGGSLFLTFQTLSLFFQRGKKIRVAPVENWFQMPDELSPLKAKRTDGFVTASRQIEPSAPQRRIEASHPC
jgi:hypothetical protein